MPMNFTEPSKSNFPSDESPHQCWEMLKWAHQAIKSALISDPIDKDKLYQGVLDVRKHQEHIGAEIVKLSDYDIIEQDLQDWLVSDPKRTAKMLHTELVKTINQEVRNVTIAIKDKYRKKLDEYRGNNKGANFKR